MKLRNLKYYIKSASSSFIRNGIMTFASFITVTCCLFLFGVFLLFTMNMNYISEQIEAQCEVQAYIDINADETVQQNAYNEILMIENVLDAELETKDQAFNNFKQRLGTHASVLEGLEGKDFLRSSIKISLRDIRSSAETVKKISKISGIEEVKNRQDIVQKVIGFTDVIKSGSAIAMLILLAIAVFIIQNTIKLSVYAREKEIHIMKFVGATDHFIRMPFVLEGIMIGALGFMVSFVIISLGYNASIGSLQSLINLFEFVPLEACILQLSVSMAAFGVLMGAAGSGLSLKRHLKV
ncbi:MAG: permease-like cell division protein FtsX [Clostridia bacterium]|nr:permease-like cell division protein FtsX [Clostridia bacterium]MBQ6937284.1 permease-like cell division protein FtsX [Clostridia bacterium]